MLQPVRAQFRNTPVVTASGTRLGCLCDLEIDLDTATIHAIGVAEGRFWSGTTLWIQKKDIVRWEKERIMVKDLRKTVAATRSTPASTTSMPAVSCSYDDRS